MTKKKPAVAVLFMLCATMASAQEIRPGCYARVYAQSHLDANPAQVVREIRLSVGDWLSEVTRKGLIEVIAANQGHARMEGNAGRVLSQFLLCGTEADALLCQVECDGGFLQVTKQSGDSLTFRTRYLMVGETEECGGAMDLAEVPGQWVSYRLDRVPEAVCAGMGQ
ncbi:hypothetical protein [Tropicibacter sp. S64]|uniref:hypothetical protein n=1 Tax=Tropicibacter sp. S64 TaxID=3415122 RepID=UPI003C7BE0E5